MLECKSQNGNIVIVCRNFPANTGLHGAFTINSFKTHYQSELLGHFSVCLPPQCWRNNIEREKGSTKRKKMRLVEVSQLFLSGSVGTVIKHVVSKDHF